MNAVDAAIRRVGFWQEIWLVHQVTSIYDAFMNWALGCWCHRSERGKRAQPCGMRALRLVELPAKREAVAQEFLRLADDIDERFPFYLDACALLRAASACLKDRLSFADMLPYWLAQARNRSAARDMLRHYDETVDTMTHHRVTHRLLSKDGPFRKSFEVFGERQVP